MSGLKNRTSRLAPWSSSVTDGIRERKKFGRGGAELRVLQAAAVVELLLNFTDGSHTPSIEQLPHLI
jgi:hypothetical protein